MQKSYYSKKEKIGWILISIIPLGILIVLLGVAIGKLLSIIGFSETFGNNVGNMISGVGGATMLLGIICAPIGIIKVIKALRMERNLDKNTKKIGYDKNLKERFRIKLVKWLFIGIIIIIGVVILVSADGTFNKKFILSMALLFLISGSLRDFFTSNFRKQKEKEGKLYTLTLDLLYEGEIKNGEVNGKGIAYYYDGTRRCEGTFKDGKLNGKGISYYANGNIRYKGNYKNGLAGGKGIIYFQNGNIAFQGTFKNDKLEGKGTMYYDSGEVRYKGLFKNGLPNGKGTVYYQNGSIASQGTFKNDKLEGKGTCYYDNGGIFCKGNFKNGKFNGKGIIYYDNGNKWQEGTFINGKLEGTGKIFYKSGDLLYKGEFKSGLMDGEGTMYDTNGYEIYKGKFRKGKIWNLSKRFQILLYKLLFRKK